MNANNGWIGTLLTSARPQAVAALLRQFRDLDKAEEAFQEACLKALRAWPEKGTPHDPVGWLITTGKNAVIDAGRRTWREQPMSAEDAFSDLLDTEGRAAERVDEADYRDDILRLLFICCDPELPATHQIALALRLVSGLSVAQIARAFLVSESAMEQRITRAKRRIGNSGLAYETPGVSQRAERIGAVAAVIYLMFNEGYTAGGAGNSARAALCEEAIRLARLLHRLCPADPEIMGLLALMLLQHARSAARFDANGAVILLEAQDRTLWNTKSIAEGLALVDKALRHRGPGPYQIQAAIAAQHARAPTAAETNWREIEQLYGVLEYIQPSPVVTLNRAVALFKARGPEDALAMIEPLGGKLDGYFYFHGARGAFLSALGRTAEASAAFGRAIALANTPAEADYIRSQLDALSRQPAE